MKVETRMIQAGGLEFETDVCGTGDKLAFAHLKSRRAVSTRTLQPMQSTTLGCLCQQSWTLAGLPTCNDYCCNPDGDSSGDWCLVLDDSCQGLAWGYCQATSRQLQAAVASCTQGDSVQAVWAGSGNYYAAVIASIQSDGTITVDWDDGDTSHRTFPADQVIHARDF